MIRRPPRSTLFPTRRSSDLLGKAVDDAGDVVERVIELFSRRKSSITDRKSTRLNSSHANISYAVFCLKKKTIGVETVSGATSESASEAGASLGWTLSGLSAQ